MEFNELKKIWDTQNNEPMYVINEKAMHNHVLSKKNQGLHITNITELLLIIVNLASGAFILSVSLSTPNTSIFMYALAAWMFVTALYFLSSRIYRLKANKRFDRSMLSDLQYALSTAAYQVRLSTIGRWNSLPIAIFIFLGLWDGGKPIWMAFGILIFFVVVNYLAGWEHNIYKARRRELEILQQQLEAAD